MGKRLIAGIVLCGILSLCCISGPNLSKKAKCAEDTSGVSWTFDEESGTLTFSGSGVIKENSRIFEYGEQPEWYEHINETKHIVISDGITEIGMASFFVFANLQSVTMADSVTKIGDWAFSDCINMNEITLSKNIVEIGTDAFSNCMELQELVLPDSLKRLGSIRFSYKIKKLIIPDSVKKLDNQLLANCLGLEEVRLPRNIKTIKPYDFVNCRKLTKLEIPQSVQSIYMSAFPGSGLKTIDIPGNVTAIKNGDYGRPVFELVPDEKLATRNLRQIIIRSKKVKSIQKNSFSGLSKKVVIKVPGSKLKAYSKMLYGSGMSKNNKVKAI
ncbi:MAG: leucine-rich repeat domain-containing protein [Eubacterium sp.]|nr:leucine-rich repeat domain-containing protein [Eubacterium sp.]